jgi:hypothetical protein
MFCSVASNALFPLRRQCGKYPPDWLLAFSSAYWMTTNWSSTWESDEPAHSASCHRQCSRRRRPQPHLSTLIISIFAAFAVHAAVHSDTPGQPSQVLPASSQVLPASSQVLPASSQVLPASSQVLPASPQVLPASPQVLPASPQVLPASPQVLPASPQVLPASPQVLPASPQVLPASSQVLPASSQVLPASPQVLPASPQMPPASSQVPGRPSQNGPFEVARPEPLEGKQGLPGTHLYQMV